MVVQISEGDEFGLAYPAGSKKHYRAYVGPPADYDLIGGLCFSVLFQLGLRETHKLLDLGCGSLRAGRMLIPYLRPGNYYGLEPNGWLVDKGIEGELGKDILEIKEPVFSNREDWNLSSFGARFDFVLAQSIFSHTYPDLTQTVMRNIRDVLTEDGVLIATYAPAGDAFRKEKQQGSGWFYEGSVPYEWRQFRQLADKAGLIVRPLAFPHPRQKWFCGALEKDRIRNISLAE